VALITARHRSTQQHQGLRDFICERLDCRGVNFLTTTAAVSAASSVSLSGQLITTRLTCQIFC